MYKQVILIPVIIFTMFMTAETLTASSSLLYIEAQGVGGYTSMGDNPVLYSMKQDDPMQKPSVGVDYIQKFSTETGDFATLFFQGRAAYDAQEKNNIEPQVYNAYVVGKFPGVDIWAGHNRIALGLASYLDSHGLLLQPLGMMGYGFDRDWGAGISRDFEKADLKIATSTGTGMGLYTRGNYLVTGRVSYGVLSQDNFNIGESGAYGKILETMGYDTMYDRPILFSMGSIDATLLWDNFEWRAEAISGKKDREVAYAVLNRFTVKLLDENRLSLEVQPVYTKADMGKDVIAYGGISYLITSYLTGRSMYSYSYLEKEHRIILQIYYYEKVI